MSEYYIPISEYESYCNLVGLTEIEAKLFMMEVVSRVDSVLLNERLKDQHDKMAKK